MHRFRRTPYRCRGCQNRFYLYIPVEKDELDDAAAPEQAEGGQPDAETEHNPNVAKPAEP